MIKKTHIYVSLLNKLINLTMTNRRDFIKKSALGTAAITIGGMKLSAKSYNSIQGANDRVTVAVIGIGGQGGTHINSFCGMKESKNVRLKTLCDADEKFFPAKVKIVRVQDRRDSDNCLGYEKSP